MDLLSRLLGAFRMQRKMVLKGISGFGGEKNGIDCAERTQNSLAAQHFCDFCQKMVQGEIGAKCRKGQNSCRGTNGKKKLQS